MKSLKQNINGIFFCLFEILVGILLLIDPIGFTSGIIIVSGIIMMLAGLVSVIKYFRTDPQDAATSLLLVKGLASLLAGSFCVCKSHWFIVTFPVLTIIYGIVTLVTSLGKVQLTVDLIRRKNKKWFLAAISAVVSLICAVVIIRRPFASVAVLWTFTGISLIAEAVLDAITLIVSGKTKETVA